MILIDGVRYIDRTPSNEDDLEQTVREHSKDIWGETSVYFDKKKLHSPAGIGSIPDGYVVVLGPTPHWYVVEVELSSHPLFDHIVPQISKFATGVSNTASQSQIAAAMHKTIDQDDILKAWVRTKIGGSEVYKFLMDTICRPPVLAIVIDEKTEQLDEVCGQLPARFKSIEVVEFKTFQRTGSDLTVHAHLFEPLQRTVTSQGIIRPPISKPVSESPGGPRYKALAGRKGRPVTVNGREYKSAQAACEHLGIDVGGDSAVRVLKRALKQHKIESLSFNG